LEIEGLYSVNVERVAKPGQTPPPVAVVTPPPVSVVVVDDDFHFTTSSTGGVADEAAFTIASTGMTTAQFLVDSDHYGWGFDVSLDAEYDMNSLGWVCIGY
jgi:hypothetical protein